jgi:hypothetical protein
MIPNIFHFIFLLKKDLSGIPFSLMHYLAIKSAIVINDPEKVYLHYDHKPYSIYWDRLVGEFPKVICLHKIDNIPEQFNGFPLGVTQQCDYLRLQVLIKYGGIYMDTDTICVKPFTPLLENKCVLGLEGTPDQIFGLCSGVTLAVPQSCFLHCWINGFDKNTSLTDGWNGEYNYMGVQYPKMLSDLMPDLVTVVPYDFFHYPLWAEPEEFELMFKDELYDNPNAFSYHLWASSRWVYISKLTEDDLIKGNFLYAKSAKQFLAVGN